MACRIARRKTHKEYVEELYNVVGDEYTVLSTYKTSNDKILVRHNNEGCGNYEWRVQARHILNTGSRCPACKGGIKFSQYEFEEAVRARVGKDYTVIGEYKGSSHNVKIRHDSCGRVFETLGSNPLEGLGCSECSKVERGIKRRKTTESFKEDVRKVVGSEYSLIYEYYMADKHVDIKHNICGHIYKIIPTKFLRRSSNCPKCARIDKGLKSRLTHEEFLRRVESMHPGVYTFLSEYRLSHDKVSVIHNECGHKWEVVAGRLLQEKEGCPKCYLGILLTHDEYMSRLAKADSNEEFDALTKYTKSNENMTFRHRRCGYEFVQGAGYFLRNLKCPNCSPYISRGEGEILKVLNKYEIKHQTQKTFDGCYGNKSLLLFDFYIPEINTAIEFDGEQHFRPVEYFGGEKKFKQTKKYDEIKSRYCEKNGIKLVRIPYWDVDNIESIICKALDIR